MKFLHRQNFSVPKAYIFIQSSFAKNLFGKEKHIFVPTNLIKSQNSLKLTIDISGILYDLNYFDHGCFYHGSIENIPSSEAALSICEGIQGYIRLNETIYFVEPLIISDVKQLSFRKKRSSESLLHIAHKIFLPDTQYQDVVTSLRKKNEKINERHKRSVIKDLYIEVLAVADLSFQEFLESIGKNTELYILTLFNMISSIYKHPSIGVSLHVVVNSIMLLEDDELSSFLKEILEINSDIDETLENFCQFQTYVTSKFTKKRIHDVAVLLTQQSFRPDTESNKSILGLAKLGGMCEIENSCNVNYHHGISVAFTIAHEIGHNINADHDSEACSGFNTLMQTQIDFSSNSFEWSNCSRKSIQDFLDEGHGHCLENEPEIIKFEDFKHLASIPNLASSFEIQCKLEYGPNATDCLDVQIFQGQCERLFCQSDPTLDVCITSFLVADGTRCVLVDEKNFNVTVGRCKDGTCLSEEKFSLNKPVDGGWGQWPEDWTPCSHECNGGIQFKERFCNNPAPQNNGKFCLGQRKIFRTCNLQSCETNENFFKIHNDLCQNFSKFTDLNEIKDFGTLKHFYFPDEPCKLLCNPEKNSSIFFDTLQKVPDGTRCSPYSQNVCLHGICNSVGCDGELGEESIYDACRVCNGDNSTCLKQKILIKINSDTDRSNILYEIPKESTSIAIMNENSKNLIELKNIYSENDDLKDRKIYIALINFNI
ncbi:A disintegrin and metallo ase with thrombospondin motifs 12 [Brachionus plicatilis]|uniref:A disintegrin and metallo ase with thrombospondin motifs 12 n=1 Tax=Brachionus plicatilis TaxID=10195 RepID=A0A3M7PZ69_BRAPC|nr:A disintegrin and metallo ase with thrombospondin motifs 12 [Brachionus plicatilis]